MRIWKTALATCAAAAALCASSAMAAPLKFTFTSATTSSNNFSFYADDAPAAFNVNPEMTFFEAAVSNYTGKYYTASAPTSVGFYTTAWGGGLELPPYDRTFSPISAQLFSGSVNAPKFLTGAFNLYGDTAQTDLLGTLNVTAAPEPATWAMMILGFGVVGLGLRRSRKTTVKVRYA